MCVHVYMHVWCVCVGWVCGVCVGMSVWLLELITQCAHVQAGYNSRPVCTCSLVPRPAPAVFDCNRKWCGSGNETMCMRYNVCQSGSHLLEAVTCIR